MHLHDYLGMKLTDIMNDEKGSIILEFNNGPALVFRNVQESNMKFKKDFIVDKVEKIKTEKKIKENKAAQKKKKK